MRLGWSVLCRGFTVHDGSLSLERVYADSKLEVSVAEPPPSQVTLSPTIILISHWFPETDLDLKLYPAILRIVAPEDNQILEEWRFSIDFLQTYFRLAIFHINELTFVGNGLYKFHIEVLEYGEWIIMSRNSLYESKTVS